MLQIVSELETGWCARENVGLPREVDCEISHQLERETKHLKTLRGNPIEENPIEENPKDNIGLKWVWVVTNGIRVRHHSVC